MPRHSVIISNYNYGRFLKESVASVLNQTLSDFEILLCDDGSTDDSNVVMAELKQLDPRRIKLVAHENIGQGATFNRVIPLCKGTLISFLDADDYWYPQKLEWLEEAAQSNPHASIYQHNLEICYGIKATGCNYRDQLEYGDCFGRTQEKNRLSTPYLPSFSPTSALSFPGKVMDRILPIPDEFRTCADGYLTRTAFCWGDVVANHEVFGVYRLHGGNSVFQNHHHDQVAYTSRKLLPALNAYYHRNQIRLRLRSPKKDKSRRITFVQRLSSYGVSPRFKVPDDQNHVDLKSLLTCLNPSSILFIRSDRNQIALYEIEAILPENCALDCLTSVEGKRLSRNASCLRNLFTFDNGSELEFKSFSRKTFEQLREKQYDLVLYGNHKVLNRSNIRDFCRHLGQPWFGYSGAGKIRLESYDVFRLLSSIAPTTKYVNKNSEI